MRSLNDSPAFDMPVLVEIKAVKQGDLRLAEFILDVPLTRVGKKRRTRPTSLPHHRPQNKRMQSWL